MPSTCCVPGCNSNYSSSKENIRVFKFPIEVNIHEEWLRKIPRKDWTPGPRTVVCIKHFREEDIIKEDIINKPGGSVLKVPRERFKLVPSAVPCIFPNLPSYLSEPNPAVVRKHPDIRHKEFLQREEAKIDDFLNADQISSFEDLLNCTDIIKANWNSYIEKSRVTYYKLEANSLPLKISICFSIEKDLSIKIFLGKQKIKDEDMRWLFDLNINKVLCVQRCVNLFSYLNNQENNEIMSLNTILLELKL